MSDERPDDTAGEPLTPEEAAETAVAAAESAPAEDAPAAAAIETPAGEITAEEAARPSMDRAQLEAIVEALVFASPEPLTPKMLFKLLADEPKDDVQAALDALVARYEHPGGLHLAQVAGGYQITTRPELHEWVRRLFHERNTQKLSVASLETLSVIAYRQPVTAAEVNEIRAVNASGVLSTLLERHLIKIVGRKNVVGRPFLYGTTKEFLVRFGLKDLNDLPKIEDMVQALGFDPPALLMEKPITDEMLPLDAGDDGAADGDASPAAASDEPEDA
ncbi:MAG: SMC-Scp complex subunit ScpB [Vicinamibacterales bacterium]